MATSPQNLDLELTPRRHHWSRHDADCADRQVVPEVNPERRIDCRRLEYAVADHRLRAVRDLFGRLERELHAARELERREAARYLEANRHVPVMTACVHLPGLPGAIGDGVCLLDGQGVHVGPEEHAAAIL